MQKSHIPLLSGKKIPHKKGFRCVFRPCVCVCAFYVCMILFMRERIKLLDSDCNLKLFTRSSCSTCQSRMRRHMRNCANHENLSQIALLQKPLPPSRSPDTFASIVDLHIFDRREIIHISRLFASLGIEGDTKSRRI